MLPALDQNRNLVVRIVDSLAATFAAANLSVDSELVEPGQIVSSVGHNETMVSVTAVKPNPQSDETAGFGGLETFRSFVDSVGFGLLLTPLTWCQLTVESFWTQL